MRLFRALILLGSLGALFPSLAFAQTPDEPNEGSRLEYDSANEIYRFMWWGKLGRTYFLQHSEDLQQWFWLPLVEPGADAVKEWGFTSSGDKFFVRLKYTDTPTTDPEGDDFDGDGVNNLDEVEQGTDPFLNTDTDGDGLSDDLELQQGGNPNDYFSQGANTIVGRIFVYSGGNASVEASQFADSPVIFKVVNAANNEPLVNVPVTIDIPIGTGLVSTTNGGPTQAVIVVRTDAQGLARAYFKAP